MNLILALLMEHDAGIGNEVGELAESYATARRAGLSMPRALANTAERAAAMATSVDAVGRPHPNARLLAGLARTLASCAAETAPPCWLTERCTSACPSCTAHRVIHDLARNCAA